MPPQNFCDAGLTSPVCTAAGAFRNTGMLELPPDAPLFSSIGDTSRIERNLRGGPVLDCCSGSGELGGEMSSYVEGEVTTGSL